MLTDRANIYGILSFELLISLKITMWDDKGSKGYSRFKFTAEWDVDFFLFHKIEVF